MRRPLRARRLAGDREPFVDRIQEQHFAATPDRWFGRSGGFTVRVCGLPGGIAGKQDAERVANVHVAGRQLGRGDVTLTALDQPSRGWRGPVRVELGLATISGAGTGTWQPNPGAFAVRGSIDLDAAGVVGSATASESAPGGTRVAMLRLAPLDGAPGRFFPGATLELASAAPGSTAAVEDSQLAREGFLRGVLHVTIPPLRDPRRAAAAHRRRRQPLRGGGRGRRPQRHARGRRRAAAHAGDAARRRAGRRRGRRCRRRPSREC